MPTKTRTKRANERALITFFKEQDRKIVGIMTKMLLAVGNTDRPTIKMLDNYRAQIREILKDLHEGGGKITDSLVRTAYGQGVEAADADLRAHGIDIITNPGIIHERTARVLSEAISSRLEDVSGVIGRRVDDIFRTVQLEAATGSALGYQTVKDAARTLRSDLVEKGITSFRDAAGRNWDLATYAEMAAITVTTEARNRGTWNEFAAHGEDLVIVSTHPMSCPKCAPWQGVVLSISGSTPGYATLQDAEGDGLFHPRCRHATALHIPEEGKGGKAGAAGGEKSGKAGKGEKAGKATKAEKTKKAEKKKTKTAPAPPPEPKPKPEPETEAADALALALAPDEFVAGPKPKPEPETEAADALALAPDEFVAGLKPSPAYLKRLRKNWVDALAHPSEARMKAIEKEGRRLQGELQELLPSDKTRVGSLVDEDDFRSILRDGRQKSQFEIGHSGGYYNPSVRARFEKGLFQYPENMNKADRPTYGLLVDSSNLSPRGYNGGQYGDVLIVYKNEVKRFATFTVGDSLNNNLHDPSQIASPVLAPSVESITVWGRNEGERLSFGSVREGVRTSRHSYIEVQYHKQSARVENIERVVFSFEPRDETKALMAERNIEWSVDKR